MKNDIEEDDDRTPFEEYLDAIIDIRKKNGHINPYPKQILTTDNLGNVTGAYDNPKWEEWERENKG